MHINADHSLFEWSHRSLVGLLMSSSPAHLGAQEQSFRMQLLPRGFTSAQNQLSRSNFIHKHTCKTGECALATPLFPSKNKPCLQIMIGKKDSSHSSLAGAENAPVFAPSITYARSVASCRVKGYRAFWLRSFGSD